MEKTYRKSWITKGILVSIKKKNKIFTINFVNQKIKKEKNHYKKIQKMQKYYSKSHKNKQGETLKNLENMPEHETNYTYQKDQYQTTKWP